MIAVGSTGTTAFYEPRAKTRRQQRRQRMRKADRGGQAMVYRRTARATRKGKDERKTETGGGLAAIEKDQPMTTYSAMTRFLFFFHVE